MNQSLYQQMIIDHSKSPCGFNERPEGCCEQAHNPMCGDEIELCVTLNDDIIEDIQFNAKGCSISIAAASILVNVIKGQKVSYFHQAMDDYLSVLYGEERSLPNKLSALSGVSKYPMRVKCASFAWHAAKAAIQQANLPIQLSAAVQKYWQSLVTSQQGIGIHLQFKQIGCMGWQFVPTVIDKSQADLVLLDYTSLNVWIDPNIIAQVKGTTVDLSAADDLGQAKVIFNHPKAQEHCGCGESFFMESK